jgi:hypothetical protein
LRLESFVRKKQDDKIQDTREKGKGERGKGKGERKKGF